MTYTRARGITFCDDCHEVVGDGWRNLAAHRDAHYRAAQLAARQARVDAMGRSETRCDTSVLSTIEGVRFGTIQTSEATSDLTPKPPLNTPIERSIHMQNRASQSRNQGNA